MRKRVITLILAVCLALPAFVSAFAAMSLSNFSVVRTYSDDFADVARDAWYYAVVAGVFERGIMDGKSADEFDPAGMLTIAEAITIAATLHRGYHTGRMDFQSGSPWYAPYLNYALRNGIPVGAYRNMNAWATRSDFAFIIAGALPDEALTPQNNIADGAIPDVAESFSYGAAVYRLYRAGVLAGSDETGTFFPGRTISRAEAAAIILRTVSADARVRLSLSPVLSGEQIYSLASPAVFFVEVFDDEGETLRTGSGFFISESGLAVTNYHVVVGATAAQITTDDGETFDIAGIHSYNRARDLALVRVEGTGFPHLELADSERLQTGATVFTLGSPLGLQASFSRGIVSQAVREVTGMEFIQIDAPISSGSSGGALLDSSGKVLGVTTASMRGGQITQNLNLAVPINLIREMSVDAHVSLDSIIIKTESYSGFEPAPNFGAFFGVIPFDTNNTRGNRSYSYRLIDMPGNPDDVIEEYTHLLEQNLYYHYGNTVRNGEDFSLYRNARRAGMVSIGVEVIRDERCFTVHLS